MCDSPCVPQNRLANETSPYLLQHAENPVDWYAWGDEALKKAADENKPIFLSIGYSSCHWCHVMAHESFESQEIAQFMNENFVNIKVDREERPDIDDVYQKACQMVTGQGGWPLSVFLTPDQKPFHVGTYYPPLDSYGRPGFGSVCRQLAQAWKERDNEINTRADQFVGALYKMDEAIQEESETKTATLDRILLDEAAINLYDLGDATYGGFGSAPKFPNAACVSFLFRYATLSNHKNFQKFALRTLDKMARGGIFDQIGGGFHRYSTDARWLVPHFEKMLYDNALVPINYAEAYQITGQEFYLDVMKKTLDFVLREMRSPEGGFYSAYDADSEGVEGMYYTWKKAEIVQILGDTTDTDLFCLYYDVTDGGNWEGQTILCNNVALSTAAFKVGMSEEEAVKSLAASSAKLLEARSRRVAPGLDEKILVSWNALFITALARGYRVSGNSAYLEAAKGCVSFIIDNMFDGDTLLRTYKDGRAKIEGYLEDYAYLACSLLDLFEVESDPEYLELAIQLGHTLSKEFWDSDTRSFFMTSGTHEKLIIRPQSRYDLSVPSGNSVAAYVMLRLYHITGEIKLMDICRDTAASQARAGAENPFALGYMLNVISMLLTGMREITILNTSDRDVCRQILLAYLPYSMVMMINDADQLERLSTYSFFTGKRIGSETCVYVCQNSVCSRPMYGAEEIRAALNLSKV